MAEAKDILEIIVYNVPDIKGKKTSFLFRKN